MNFEDLTDVHTRRYAERVQNHVNRAAIREVRHVFRRQDLRNDTFVTVTAGEFIADLELTFNCDVNFNHFDNARRKFVTFFEAVEFLAEHHLNGVELVASAINDAAHLEFHVGFQRDVVQEFERDRLEVRVSDDLAFREQLLRSVFVQEDARSDLADQQSFQTRQRVVADDVSARLPNPFRVCGASLR